MVHLVNEATSTKLFVLLFHCLSKVYNSAVLKLQIYLHSLSLVEVFHNPNAPSFSEGYSELYKGINTAVKTEFTKGNAVITVLMFYKKQTFTQSVKIDFNAIIKLSRS